MKNEITRIKINENITPAHQHVRNFPQNQIERNDINIRNEEHRPVAP
jgi:hypothetical protein